MVVLGVELSCNQSSTTCPGDVIQCECQVTSDTPLLEWLARDLQLEEDVLIETYLFSSRIGVPRSSGPYTTVLCSATSGIPVTLTSKLTATLTTIVDVTCRNSGGGGNSNTTRLTVAGKLSSMLYLS